ncbi:hypothetical protein MMC14_002479 [Varicellaria rhodocarpa]|nr:hypothetical protein [Varicellaria rhodocarpa]
MGWISIKLPPPTLRQPAWAAPVPVASAVRAAPTTTLTAPVASVAAPVVPATSAPGTLADLGWWMRQKLGDLARYGFVKEGDEIVYEGRYAVECTILVTRVQGGWIYLRITFPFATTRTPSARTAANKKGKKADDRARRGTNRADEETTGPHSNPAPPPGYHLAGPSSSNPRRNIVDVPTAPYDGAPQPGVSSSSSWGRPSAGSNVLGASAWEDVPARYDYIPPAPLPPSALALLLLLFLLQQWQPPTRPSSTARPLLRGAPRRSWKCGLTPHAIWRMPFGSTSQVPPSTHPPTALAFGGRGGGDGDEGGALGEAAAREEDGGKGGCGGGVVGKKPEGVVKRRGRGGKVIGKGKGKERRRDEEEEDKEKENGEGEEMEEEEMEEEEE